MVRTLHNPFGNRANAVLVGGSDTAGVNAAAGVFAIALVTISMILTSRLTNLARGGGIKFS